MSGILAVATDIAVPTVAYVASALGLRGPSVQAANTLCSKLRFRTFLAEQRLPCPVMHVVEPGSAVLPTVDWSQRWIIKPDQSSGSKGIRIVSSEDDLKAHVSTSLSASLNGRAILEQYIDGAQGTCEGALHDGKIAFMAVTERWTAPFPYVATAAHLLPSPLSAALQERLRAQLERVFRVLELRDGPFDCDFVATPFEVYLLEATPRVGGNSLAKLLDAAFGIDIVRYAVQVALGEPSQPLARNTPMPAAVRILGVPRAGALIYDRQGAEMLKGLPWVKELLLDYPRGTVVDGFRNGRTRVGECLIVAETRSELEERLQKVSDTLQLSVDSDICPSEVPA